MSQQTPLAAARERFAAANIPMPPVPDDLAPRLKKYGKLQFGTRREHPGLYLFDRWVDEYLRGEVPGDYLAFGYGGHGFNSMALHYYLVRGPLAIFDQIAWGGITSSSPLDRDMVEAQFAQIEIIINCIESAQLVPGERLIVVASDFSFCRWAYLRPDSFEQWQTETNTLLAITGATIAAQRLAEGKTP